MFLCIRLEIRIATKLGREMKEYIGTIKGIDLIKKSAPRARISMAKVMRKEA